MVRAVSQRMAPPTPEVPEAHPDAVNEVSILEMRDYMANMLLRDTDSMREGGI